MTFSGFRLEVHLRCLQQMPLIGIPWYWSHNSCLHEELMGFFLGNVDLNIYPLIRGEKKSFLNSEGCSNSTQS